VDAPATRFPCGVFAKKFSFQNLVLNQSLDPTEQGFRALPICLRSALRNALTTPRFSTACATGSGCHVHVLAALSRATPHGLRVAPSRKKIHLLSPGISRQAVAFSKS
jgi:hypothetical protein